MLKLRNVNAFHSRQLSTNDLVYFLAKEILVIWVWGGGWNLGEYRYTNYLTQPTKCHLRKFVFTYVILFNCYTNDKPYTITSCNSIDYYIPQSTMVNTLFPTVHQRHSALMYNRPQTRFTELNITLSSLSKSDVRDRVVYCGLGEAL